MSSLLAVAAVSGVMLLAGGEPVGNEAFIDPGPVAVYVAAEGHPERITIESIDPNGIVLVLEVCDAVTSCSASNNLDQFGLWRFIATVEYEHTVPDGSPYIDVDGISAIVVDPTLIFRDGFEDGTTDAWSKVKGGE